jgi:hypothetical protein
MLNSVFVFTLDFYVNACAQGVLDYQYYAFLCIQCQYSISIFNLNPLFRHSITQLLKTSLFFFDIIFVFCVFASICCASILMIVVHVQARASSSQNGGGFAEWGGDWGGENGGGFAEWGGTESWAF